MGLIGHIGFISLMTLPSFPIPKPLFCKTHGFGTQNAAFWLPICRVLQAKMQHFAKCFAAR